jgi:hypothetical protein
LNKLSQSREMIQLTAAEKDLLRRLLQGGSAPVVNPPTDPGSSNQLLLPSSSEIIAATAAAMAEVERLGHRFKTREEVASLGFDEDDRKRAMMVTLRVAWELSRTYLNIGLEHYAGPSGVMVSNGDTLSFDIILLSRNGPSVDILGAGVIPQALIESDPQHIPGWQRDWRPALAPGFWQLP